MSVVRLLVLGAIKRRGTTHGYRVYRDLVEWHVETWTVIRPGSIYHAISQLQSQGFIVAIPSNEGQKLGPAKTEYKLTTNGEYEFQALLEKALKDSNLIELSAGIAFMEYLRRQRVITLLKERLGAQRKIEEFLHALPTENIPTVPSKHPELIRVWSESYAHAAQSTKKLISSLQSGNYVFKNEEARK
jgi:DNA-binding PadR family transcriptional regulator